MPSNPCKRRTTYRDAVTGKYITESAAAANPRESVRETSKGGNQKPTKDKK